MKIYGLWKRENIFRHIVALLRLDALLLLRLAIYASPLQITVGEGSEIGPSCLCLAALSKK